MRAGIVTSPLDLQSVTDAVEKVADELGGPFYLSF
jgi:hypothetical protein